jgi:arabinogalactan oligomer/maltooligosaccharide transport system substrate-binding protein
VAEGLAFHNQFRDYFDFGTDDITWDNSVAAFQRGETAFTISGPWAIADARANGIDFGTAKLPTIGGNQPHAFSGVRTVNVSSFSNNLPAAFAFAAFVASEEGFRIVFEVQGHMAALQDTSGIPGIADDEHLRGLAEQSPFTTPMPTIPQVDLMWTPLEDIFTFTWNRDMSIPEAQERAMETYEMLLNAQGLSMFD